VLDRFAAGIVGGIPVGRLREYKKLTAACSHWLLTADVRPLTCSMFTGSCQWWTGGSGGG